MACRYLSATFLTLVYLAFIIYLFFLLFRDCVSRMKQTLRIPDLHSNTQLSKNPGTIRYACSINYMTILGSDSCFSLPLFFFNSLSLSFSLPLFSIEFIFLLIYHLFANNFHHIQQAKSCNSSLQKARFSKFTFLVGISVPSIRSRKVTSIFLQNFPSLSILQQPYINASTLCLSLEDVLLHHSLYEFMHPSEVELAKSDLSNFLNLRILAGSVTRCRLLSLEDIAHRASGLQPSSGSSNQGAVVSKHHDGGSYPSNDIHKVWTIVDIVVYTATHELVLAFFHNIDFGPLCMNDKVARRDDEYSHSNFANQDTLNMIQAAETVKRMSRANEIGRMSDDFMLPKRFFQITDHLAQNVAFSWPAVNSANPEESLQGMIRKISKDIAVKEFRSPSYKSSCKIITGPHSTTCGSARTHDEDEDISCTRHFYASVNIELFNKMYNFHKILIPYGTITFETIQVTPLEKSTGQQADATHIQLQPVEQQQFKHVSLPPLKDLYCKSEGFGDSNFGLKHMTDDPHRILPLSTQILSSIPLTTPSTDQNQTNVMKIAYASAGSKISNEDHFSRQSTEPYHLSHNRSMSGSPYYEGPTAAAAASSASSSRILYSCRNHQQYRMDHPQQQLPQQQQQQQQQHLPRIEVHNQLLPSFSIERRKRYPNKRQSSGNNNNRMNGEPVKVCTRCLTSQSPEWRRGPDGHKTLCNACGLRYSRLRSKQWRAALAAREAND